MYRSTFKSNSVLTLMTQECVCMKKDTEVLCDIHKRCMYIFNGTHLDVRIEFQTSEYDFHIRNKDIYSMFSLNINTEIFHMRLITRI